MRNAGIRGVSGIIHHVILVCYALGLAMSLAGCGQLGYYAQSIHGQLSMLAEARPVSVLLQDPTLDPRLRDRLKLAEKIRAFAVTDLDLPDNRSYHSYADLKRPFVVWNVFAAGPLSLKLKPSCFLIVGCVDYRGYYAHAAADAYAADMRRQGWETFVAGVPAYSTLGYFADPLLNTFLFYPEGELARLIFHELAHEVLYVRGDTTFNESFAVTVETVGVQRWLARYPERRAAYDVFATRRRAFRRLVTRYRERLAALYANPVLTDDEKRAEKAHLFDALRADYARLKAGWGGYAGYDAWFAQDLNNAKIGAFTAYTRWVPAFTALLMQQHGDMRAFFAAVRRLSRLPADQRHARLDQLMPADAMMKAGRLPPISTQGNSEEMTSFSRPSNS